MNLRVWTEATRAKGIEDRIYTDAPNFNSPDDAAKWVAWQMGLKVFSVASQNKTTAVVVSNIQKRQWTVYIQVEGEK